VDRAAIWIPYCGSAPAPAELLARWNLDPVLIAALALALCGGLHWSRAAGLKRLPFLFAMALLVLLFVSPFCALTSALFSARAVHHLALTTLVAPLLATALPARHMPGGVALWTLIHGATFWAWHAPTAYEAALSNIAVYWLMQASLLFTGLGLWRSIRSAPMPAAIGALLATMVQMGLLGALLTFAGTPFYAPHYLGPLSWGLSPLEDQQLAGLIMWAPGAGLYLAAALVLLSRWFARAQRTEMAT
ncbi:cytochrome c oxidase assembly protein, partial [Sphingomonas sp. SRS2]|uniref:cytochrome c oxidase assembly protein n=1 Tax=Sphingomonas sp. SRS2 TaxID=133190 RepID=UPI002E112795